MSGVTRSRIESLGPGLHWFGDGLGMRIGRSGAPKSWVHQKSGGKRTPLGRWSTMDIRQARLECGQRNMVDMVEDEQVTLREAMEQWERRLRLREGSETIIEAFADWERCRQSFANPHIR